MSLLIKSLPLLSLRATRTFSFYLFKPSATKILPQNNKIFSSVSASDETATNTTALKPQLPHKDALEWVSRTGFCGELTPDDVGKRVRLCGWVAFHRVHGGLTFLNLRDHTGIVQVFINALSFVNLCVLCYRLVLFKKYRVILY